MKEKVPAIIEDHVLSYTAKYWGFFATHWHQGVKCWLIGAVNTETGETTARHYNEKASLNEEAAKYAASSYWEEFKEGLKRSPTEEEKDLDAQLLEAWEDAAERIRKQYSGELPAILRTGRDPATGGRFLN